MKQSQAQAGQIHTNFDPYHPQPFSFAWLAGYIDGEGCIRITASDSLSLQISSCELPDLEWIKKHLGGTITDKRETRERRRPSYSWGLYGQNALEVIEKILPFLRGKRLQAEHVLKWAASEKDDVFRESHKAAIKAIKKVEYH